ncbi:MAG TPA: BCCT family transporter, partial [Savagea sp.]
LNAFAIALIFIFLVTSADSATYILASMTSKGSIHPPLFLKIVWGVLISGTAAVLLYTGGLSALQTASLVSALPFTVVLVLLMFAITKTLRDEVRPVTERDIRRFKRIQEKVDDETE